MGVSDVRVSSVKVVFSKKDFLNGHGGLWPRVTLTDGVRTRAFPLRSFSRRGEDKAGAKDLAREEVMKAVCLTAFGRSRPPDSRQKASSAVKTDEVYRGVSAAVSRARSSKAISARIESAKARMTQDQVAAALLRLFRGLGLSEKAAGPHVIARLWRGLQNDEAVRLIHES
jgi:hypothetical protein